MSAIGVASARNGARTASASSGGPAQHMRARITTLPWCSAGTNGIGGQGMTLAIVESPSGAASAASTNPAIVSGRRGQQQQAADDPRQRVQPELEPGHDADVGPRATDRPEQVGLVRLIDHVDGAVGRHDLSGEQAVDREPVAADEVADAAARRDPADAHGAGVAEAGREPDLGRGGRVCPRREPAAGPGGPRRLVDLEAVEVADVEHDAAVGRAVRRAAVAAGADREVQPVLAGERDDLPDIVDVGNADDQCRSRVDAAEHDAPLRVVVGIVWVE